MPLTLHEILAIDTRQFAHFLCAFMECDAAIQEVIVDMADIVTDQESEEDERSHALDTLMEALFPEDAFRPRKSL